ncbi:MAG: peptidoglycan DD-metalloendopeptidase family protein, partial [Pseudomonadota bacterium]
MKLIDMGVLLCSGRTQSTSRRRDVKAHRPLPIPVSVPKKTFYRRSNKARLAGRAGLASAVLGWAICGGIDRLGALVPGQHSHSAQAQANANTPQDAVWIIDANGDGIGDYANPTHGLIRGVDAYGSGQFGAVRDGGKRKHHGVDYIATPGDWVEAPIAGVVTKYGYAYRRNTDLRYIEIKNTETGMRARVLYIDATVADGATISAGEIIGTAQNLADRYPGGITN